MRRNRLATWIIFLTVTTLVGTLAAPRLHRFVMNENQNNLLIGTWSECNPILSARKILIGDQSPPKNLYYYGELKSAESWKNQIEEQRRFKHKPFRRGLFSAETLADAEPISPTTNSTFLAIELRSECTSQDKVSTLVGLPASVKFKNWYSKIADVPPFTEWKEQCFSGDGMPKSEEFQFFESPIVSETICEKIVNRFWNDQQIGLIQDHLSAKSWIIRDPKCVETLNASAKFWVEALSQQGKLWEKACESGKSQRERVRLWFSSVHQSLEAIESQSEMSGLFKEREQTREIASEKLEFSARDFAGAFDQAVKRCQANNQRAEFKDGIFNILTHYKMMESLDIKNELERLCL